MSDRKRERSYRELFLAEEDEVDESYRIQEQEMAFELGADYGRVMGWYDEPEDDSGYDERGRYG